MSAPQAYRLYRSASRGVSGVVLAVARLARLGVTVDESPEFVGRAVDWLLSHAATPDDQMPGLHFGEAGVAVAICEAVAAGLLLPGPWLAPYVHEALDGQLDWPDITHGAAGQGIAALQCTALLDGPDFVPHAARCAAYLVDTQRRDGHWPWPDGVAGLENATYTGYGHGVAGIIGFLSGYSRVTGDTDALRAAERGVNWLLSHVDAANSALTWPRQVGEDGSWHWWCHGGPGIALGLMAYTEASGDGRCVSYVERALRVHPLDLRYPNLSQCHGLSGLGEIYLEAARVLGGEEWRRRATTLADTLAAMRIDDGDRVTWVVENPFHATSDLMIGCGGVAHFIARASLPTGNALAMPLTLDPPGRVRRPIPAVIGARGSKRRTT